MVAIVNDWYRVHETSGSSLPWSTWHGRWLSFPSVWNLS